VPFLGRGFRGFFSEKSSVYDVSWGLSAGVTKQRCNFPLTFINEECFFDRGLIQCTIKKDDR